MLSRGGGALMKNSVVNNPVQWRAITLALIMRSICDRSSERDSWRLLAATLTRILRTSIISRLVNRTQTRLTEESRMASENVAEFTDQNFEAEVLKSTTPVLV